MVEVQSDRSLPPDSVCVERLVAATPAQIWRIWSSPAGMQRWLKVCLFQPRLGGRVLLDTSTTGDNRIVVWGRVRELSEARRLSFGWRVLYENGAVWPADTLVSLDCEERSGGSLVRLTHSGFAALGELAARSYSIYYHCWVETPFMQRLEAQTQKTQIDLDEPDE